MMTRTTESFSMPFLETLCNLSENAAGAWCYSSHPAARAKSAAVRDDDRYRFF